MENLFLKIAYCGDFHINLHKRHLGDPMWKNDNIPHISLCSASSTNENNLYSKRQYFIYQLQTLQNMVKEVNKCQPDIVCFTGDIFDTSRPANKSILAVARILSQVNAQKIFFIAGNHDPNNGFCSPVELLVRIIGDVTKNNINQKFVFLKENSSSAHNIVIQDQKVTISIYALNNYPFLKTFYEFQQEELDQLDNSTIKLRISLLMGHFTHDLILDKRIRDNELEIIPARELKTSFDIICLGHIHTDKIVDKDYQFYSGSLFQTNHGESGQRKFIKVINYDILNKRIINSRQVLIKQFFAYITLNADKEISQSLEEIDKKIALLIDAKVFLLIKIRQRQSLSYPVKLVAALQEKYNILSLVVDPVREDTDLNIEKGLTGIVSQKTSIMFAIKHYIKKTFLDTEKISLKEYGQVSDMLIDYSTVVSNQEIKKEVREKILPQKEKRERGKK